MHKQVETHTHTSREISPPTDRHWLLGERRAPQKMVDERPMLPNLSPMDFPGAFEMFYHVLFLLLLI